MKIVDLAGWSGAGRTTLPVEIIKLPTVRGLSVSTIKHACHAFGVDVPNKDPDVEVHRTANCTEVADLLLPSATPLSEALARLTSGDLASFLSEPG